MDRIMADLQVIFRDIFDDNEIVLQSSTCADDIEDWDSLAQMNLLVAIEKHFGIKFSVKEVLSLKNVGEMVALISNKCSKEF